MGETKIILRDLLLKHPADIAEILSHLSEEQATELLHRLCLHKAAAEPLGEMEPDESAELLSELDREEAIKVLSRMDPDNAVDLLEELSEEEQKTLLSYLAPKEAEVLSNLLTYPPDTAGGLMSPEVIALSLDMTAQEALARLRQRVEEAETIYYAYAVDGQGALQGVLSLRDMILAQPNTPLVDLLNRDVICVPVDTDAEEVAHLFDKYNYFALPVVDDGQKLLGIITIDDVIDVIREEATEDIYGMASVPRQEGVNTRWFSSLCMRLPWLYVNLATALLAAVVVGVFEATIAKVAALAVLMGVVTGQGGSAGIQTVTILIRGIALGEVSKGKGWRLLGKETFLGILNGLAIGTTVGAVTFLWKGNPYLGLVVFLAMTFNLVAAGMAGTLIPLTLRALRIDPALASSIFLTTVTDVFGFGFLFLLARLFLPELR
jgi:magnesium transporter